MVCYGLSGGSWSCHFRDHTTNEPLRFSDYPNLTIGDVGAPNGTGATNGDHDIMHQPGFGYLPWLTTGRWFFLEEHLFWATNNYLEAEPDQRRGMMYEQNTGTYPAPAASGSAGIIDGTNGTYANRGAGWAIRTLAQTLSILPPTHTCFASLKNAWEQNMNFYKGVFVDNTLPRRAGTEVNPQGYLGEYDAATNPDPTLWDGSIWMQGMVQQAFAYASDLKVPQTTTAAQTAVVAHSLKLATGLAGGATGTGGWNYRRITVYEGPIGTISGGVKTPATTFAHMFSLYEDFHDLTSQPSTSGLSLFEHTSNDDMYAGSSSANDFFPMQLGALAYAVDKGVPGAQEGWNRVTGASNFAEIAATFHDNPRFSFAPRS